MRSLLLIALLVGTELALAAPQEPARVAILPISSVLGSVAAKRPVELAFERALVRRGWTVVDAAAIEVVLEQQRIRYLDSLSLQSIAAIHEATGANAILVGSVVMWREGSNPLVALNARLLDLQGNTLWADFASTSGADTAGPLGAGRRSTVEGVADEVIATLASRVPKPGERTSTTLNAGPFTFAPATYRSGRHPRGEIKRICILPFVSPIPGAARAVGEILAVRLEATSEFDVVEPAEFRAAMKAAGFRSVSTMTSTELAVLGRHLETMLFLRGNVHVWRDAPGGRSEVQIDMTLADVASGGILWAVTHQRRGADFSGLFQRGVIQNAVTLADRVVSEAISEQHRVRPKGSGSAATARQARKER
jgi:TolB-like protein